MVSAHGVRRVTVVTVLLIGALAGTARSQPRDPLAGVADDLTPVEVQRLFDAFELVRAQEMLDLSDAQYPDFVARLKALQEVRRRGQQARQRQLRELQRLSSQPGTDETLLAQRLQALEEHDREAVAARSAAVAEIDAILNVRQRVRFRVFEQTMERRRIDLLTRARRQQPRR